tara:strand:+ start:272 stop:448 length:177 start_codon:yes stop_codon:yes gene_type:complete
MNKIWHTIADFFELIFQAIESIGNTVNYIYIIVIFLFLVLWIFKMLEHKKNNEEHMSL